jgi:hypothetical protein
MTSLISRFILLAVFFHPALYANTNDHFASNKTILSQSYEEIDALHRFLLDIDSNLYIISEQKLNSIRYLNDVFQDAKAPEGLKRKAFDELWNTPEYFIWKLKTSNLDAILSIDSMRKNFSIDRALYLERNFVSKVKSGTRFDDSSDPFSLINLLNKTNEKVKLAIESQKEALNNLERLGALSMISKTPIKPSQSFHYMATIYNSTFDRHIKIQVGNFSQAIRYRK